MSTASLRSRIAPIAGLLVFCAALWFLQDALRNYHYRDVIAGLRALPARNLLAAGLLAVLGYVALTGYDVLALRYIGKSLPYGRTAIASFIGYAFGHNLGHSWLTGGSVRYRLYSGWGLTGADVAAVVAFLAFSFWLGFLALGAVVFLVAPPAVPGALHLPVASARPLGAVFLAAVVAYLALGTLRSRPLTLRDWEFRIPTTRLRVAQVVVSAVDWMLAAATLYVLLPLEVPVSYLGFLGLYLLGVVAGLASQVPGGLGVFEGVILLLLGTSASASALLGSLLAFRAIYYLAPLALAALLLGGYEALRVRAHLAGVTRAIGQALSAVAPQVLTVTTFLGGAILLFSGATPAERERLSWLRQLLPLPVIETSHFLGSLAGVGLLLLARGLELRLDAAWGLTAALLAAGVVLSLLKGFDYEEAIALSVMLLALLPSRRHFFRKASLAHEALSPWWVAAIGVVMIGTIWLGLFSYKHVEYSNDLWWRFALRADAPRFLRAAVGAITLLATVAIARLMRPAAAEHVPAAPEELARAEPIVARSRSTAANLVFLGDKSLLFSPGGGAFIMYGVEGRSWVALGDPVGAESEAAELVWEFRERSDRHGGWPVFYQVQARTLPLYLDVGLSLLKLGEEARVPLEAFSLEGKARKPFRNLRNRLEREGCRFEVLPPEAVAAALPELEAVSDAWLRGKRTREKGFSLGCFDPAYVRRFPAGVVRRAGRIAAFANLWLGADREELSPDLMRYLPDAPEGVMEFLFLELILWGKGEGYRWVNLGMAPLAGLEDRTLAPLWNRLGAFVFRHGEDFYNFQGLRQYKEKFDPVWEPRYLATPNGLVLPRILANVATLISGGLRGVVAR